MLWIFMVKNHFGVTSVQTSLKRANLMKKLTVKRVVTSGYELAKDGGLRI